MGLLVLTDVKKYEECISKRVLLVLAELLWNDKNQLSMSYRKLPNSEEYRLMGLDEAINL